MANEDRIFQQSRPRANRRLEPATVTASTHREIASALNASFHSSEDVPGDWSRLLSRLL